MTRNAWCVAACPKSRYRQIQADTVQSLPHFRFAKEQAVPDRVPRRDRFLGPDSALLDLCASPTGRPFTHSNIHTVLNRCTASSSGTHASSGRRHVLRGTPTGGPGIAAIAAISRERQSGVPSDAKSLLVCYRNTGWEPRRGIGAEARWTSGLGPSPGICFATRSPLYTLKTLIAAHVVVGGRYNSCAKFLD
jgi:hypothetical protein